MRSFTIRTFVPFLAGLLCAFTYACGGTVVATGSSAGSGATGAGGATGSGGATAAGGADGGSTCLPYGGGPADPNTCVDGATCYEGGTICEFTWTCTAGKWVETMMCAPHDSTASSSGG